MLVKQRILFTKEECDDIIEYHTNQPIQQRADYTNGLYSYRNVDSIKYEWIINRFIEWIESEVDCKISWFDSEKLELYFQSYEVGDKFTKHRDNKYNRCYTAALLLNDTFDGGEFSIYTDDITFVNFEKVVGNCYFFESQMEHEVKPIIAGCRNVILMFFKKSQIKFNQYSLI